MKYLTLGFITKPDSNGRPMRIYRGLIKSTSKYDPNGIPCRITKLNRKKTQ